MNNPDKLIEECSELHFTWQEFKNVSMAVTFVVSILAICEATYGLEISDDERYDIAAGVVLNAQYMEYGQDGDTLLMTMPGSAVEYLKDKGATDHLLRALARKLIVEIAEVFEEPNMEVTDDFLDEYMEFYKSAIH